MKRKLALAVLTVGVLAPMAWADVPYVPVNPGVPPIPGTILPTPIQVPGKEFSHNLDTDQFGVLTPGEVLWTDGAGGTVHDRNYGPGQVDGLANSQDVLFDALITNQTHLITGVAGRGDYLFHKSDGTSGVWMPAAAVDRITPPTSVNDIEIWGSDINVPNSSDANRFSLVGDPTGAAVFSSTGAVEYTDLQLATAIANLYGRPDVAGPLAAQLDLDAMMTKDSDLTTDSQPVPFGGNSLIFSVAPVTLNQLAFFLDGGEIFVYNDLTGTATFLNQGGVLWDTTNDVAALYGHEDITAIEAASTADVPEPATLAILGVAAAGLMLRRRK